jgi:prevent-host-death family protein
MGLHEVAVAEAQGTLDALLDLVERGEEVAITRGGGRVARLVPDAAKDREKARQAVEKIKEMRKGVTLGGLSIKDLINEGRR